MPSDSPSQTLLRSLERFSRALRESAFGLSRDLGCSRGSLSILRILERRGTAQVGDIAHLLRVDISVASRQVSQLVDEGLVERDVDAEDRRVRTVRLSAQGLALAEQIRAQLDAHAHEVFRDWTEPDIAATAAALDHLADTLVRPVAPPCVAPQLAHA